MGRSELRQPPHGNWDKYRSIVLAIFKSPESADVSYAREHGLLDNQIYKKWHQKEYLPRPGEFNQVSNLVLRALILSEHLPWVALTKPFTSEMGQYDLTAVFPGKFIGEEEKHVNAVRFAYQEATMRKPLPTITRLSRSGVEEVPDDDFISIWAMDGPNRVQWFVDRITAETRYIFDYIEERVGVWNKEIRRKMGFDYDPERDSIDALDEQRELLNDIFDILQNFIS